MPETTVDKDYRHQLDPRTREHREVVDEHDGPAAVIGHDVHLRTSTRRSRSSPSTVARVRTKIVIRPLPERSRPGAAMTPGRAVPIIGAATQPMGENS